jgi:hypothetical protein
MDRDLGMPKKSLESTSLCAAGPRATLAHEQADLPMKQTRRYRWRLTIQTAASSKAHDKDGSFNKEYCR